MKTSLRILAAASLFLILPSCRKKVENNGLTGKWIQSASFDGYVMGGSFTWHPVLPQHATVLSFTDNGGFSEARKIRARTETCAGSFRLSRDTVIVTAPCYNRTTYARVVELTPETLKLRHWVIEGYIDELYTAVK